MKRNDWHLVAVKDRYGMVFTLGQLVRVSPEGLYNAVIRDGVLVEWPGYELGSLENVDWAGFSEALAESLVGWQRLTAQNAAEVMPEADEWAELLTPEQVARWLKVTPGTVRAWIRQGRLWAIDIGRPGRRSYRIRRTEVLRFLAEAEKARK